MPLIEHVLKLKLSL